MKNLKIMNLNLKESINYHLQKSRKKKNNQILSEYIDSEIRKPQFEDKYNVILFQEIKSLQESLEKLLTDDYKLYYGDDTNSAIALRKDIKPAGLFTISKVGNIVVIPYNHAFLALESILIQKNSQLSKFLEKYNKLIDEDDSCYTDYQIIGSTVKKRKNVEDIKNNYGLVNTTKIIDENFVNLPSNETNILISRNLESTDTSRQVGLVKHKILQQGPITTTIKAINI